MRAQPFRFFESVPVLRTELLSPSQLRIVFGGAPLAGFASGGRDQSLSLFLPHPGQRTPWVPADAGEHWFAEWRAADPAVRAVMRAYTAREHRPETGELDIDFVPHADGGPAARWAARAQPGDRVTILGPCDSNNRSVAFRPPSEAGWVLLAADETALPATASILESLPAGTVAKVWIEVPHQADRRELPTEADAEITWLVHEDRDRGRIVHAVRAATLPDRRPYAWIAGESGVVRALRRHLVTERRIPKADVTFRGYWRLGATEDDLRNE
ncbi:siderophore-interacting protein [Nocardia sp. CS682]|uniref:siderophore-interacting protein n=1 Tax=Nocardia sp. CS682 TaxID=1047172 RepID=UPI0010757C0F|nr:siderophore-interacting protein [Nocardia sp. CS682]QBS44648.1 NADPH-dependent ferric siderophore reductase [Nocardia sp. CS682]